MSLYGNYLPEECSIHHSMLLLGVKSQAEHSPGEWVSE